MAYTLRGKLIDPAHVGQLYHIGIGTTSPGASAVDNLCGYNLVDDQQLGRFVEKTDLHTKSTLTQYSSENIIDRDFVNTPRVTDGDFSGGALQQTWIDPHRFWDSDLDSRVPGYLMLAPAWARRTMVTPAITAPYQVIAYGSQVWMCGTSGTSIYRVYDSAARNTGINVIRIETDGNQIFAADGVNTLRVSGPGDPIVWSTISGAIGPIRQMWAVNLGTVGHFLYYTTDGTSLFKVDLNTNTIAIPVPLGGTQLQIVDVCQYLAGVAVVTNDPGGTGFDVWYQDGQNLQHIIRVNQYFARGICQCLGQLFITATSTGWAEPPVLMQVSAGSFQILLRLGTPFTTVSFSFPSAPASSGQYVAFAVNVPQLTGITGIPNWGGGYIGIYDVLSGTYSHLPNMDLNDNPQAGLVITSGPFPKTLAFNGKSAVFCSQISGATVAQYQLNTQGFGVGYQPSGWLCSSRIDFQTPGIAKLFRRIMVHHAPLNPGESLQVNGYIDIDPIKFTTVLAPAATVTHAYSVSDPNPTVTVLTFPIRTLAHSMTFALKLTAGANNTTTPNIFYAAIEIAVPWTWEGWFDLTFRRRLLNGDEDGDQTPADLYWLLHNAWESAQPVTLYHPNGNSYTAAIEELRFEARNPVNERTPEHPAGVEWWAYILLRDSLE